MFSMRISLLLASFVTLYVQAAPAKNLCPDCTPVGAPARLQAYHHNGNHSYYEFSKHGDGYPLLTKKDKPSQKFQFMDCKPVSDKYKSTNKYTHYGQLRSVEHPNKCVTSGFYVTKGDHGALKYVPEKDMPITLEPCASEDNELYARQWMSYEPIDGCAPYISFGGYANAPGLTDVGLNKDFNSLTFKKYKNGKPLDSLRLSDTDVPYKCDA